MDNLYCGCSQPAVLFCFCKAEEKTYLCGSCVAVHLKKPGRHAILPITDEDTSLHDMYHGLNQTKSIVEFSGILDHMMTVLDQEQHSVEVALEERSDAQCKLLKETYANIKERAIRNYEDLRRAFQTAKQEVKARDFQHGSATSQNTLKLIEISAHLLSKGEKLIDVEQEIETRIHLEVKSEAETRSVESMITQWNLSSCTCSKCQEMLENLMSPKQRFDLQTRIQVEKKAKEEVQTQELKRQEALAHEKTTAAAEKLAKEAELKELRESNALLRTDLAKLASRTAELQGEVTRSQGVITDYGKYKETTEARIKQLEAELEGSPDHRGPEGGPMWHHGMRGPPPDWQPGMEGPPPEGYGHWGRRHHGDHKHHHGGWG